MSFSLCLFTDAIEVLGNKRNRITKKLGIYNPHKNNTDTHSGIKIIFTDHNLWSNSAIVSTLDIKLLGKTNLVLVLLETTFV